jgi:hypothetical protein
VYFLESAGASANNWVIFNVKKGASASTDVNHGQNDPIVGSVSHDSAMLKSLQDKVADRENKWLTDPYSVALADSIEQGFDPHNDSYTLEDQQDKSNASGTALQNVEVIHGEDTYTLQLMQQVDQGAKGIWVINSVTKQ